MRFRLASLADGRARRSAPVADAVRRAPGIGARPPVRMPTDRRLERDRVVAVMSLEQSEVGAGQGEPVEGGEEADGCNPGADK
jgi:hypothetical protein